MKIIDTHQHLLYPDHLRYSWCKGLPAFEGKQLGLPEYRAAVEGTGISESVFMEVDVDESDIGAEADFILRLASDPKSNIVGVIAACRPEDAGFAKKTESMLHPKLKGFRRVLHTQSDDVLELPLFAENVARLGEHNLTFDLCVLPRQLSAGARLVRTAPDVQFVLDHCGIPNIKGGELDPWRQRIRELAAFPNLACKISGVVAYCDPARVNTASIQPFVEHCIECFGWDRVLFGGDWPVCNLTSSIGDWVRIAREIVRGEPVERQEKLFSRNAERIYRLNLK
jgi:predicted TIM-barrel fold metal-dependent hydrolase